VISRGKAGIVGGRSRERNRRFAALSGQSASRQALLAMQKVEGSIPYNRFLRND
jgi:hypothetical protein